MSSARRVAPLLASTGISVAGDGAFIAAVPLLAASLTRNPLAISTVNAAFFAPWILVGLPVGALVDRWRRRTTMLVADILRASLLAALAVPIVTAHLTVAALIVVVLVVGIAQTFFDAAAQALIPSVVGRDKQVLATVNGQFWALDLIGRSMVGPPLGSLLFAAHRAIPFAVDAASFLVSALVVRRLPAVPPANGPHEPIGSAIRAGLRYLFDTAELRTLALSTSAYNLGYYVAFATFVLYVTTVLRLSNAMYGVLLAAGAVGGALAAWRADVITRRMSYRQTVSLATLGQSAGWLTIAVTHNLWSAGVAFALIGACNSVSSVAVGSARQVLTPTSLIGRVVTGFRLLSLGAAGVGALIGGIIATQASLTAPLVLAAVLLAIVGTMVWLHRPSNPSDRTAL